MVWFLLKWLLQKFSTNFVVMNMSGFHPVNVLFLLTMTVTAGASNPSVSRTEVTTRTSLSWYLRNAGSPKMCRKSPRSKSCRTSFKLLWWKTFFQFEAIISFDIRFFSKLKFKMHTHAVTLWNMGQNCGHIYIMTLHKCHNVLSTLLLGCSSSSLLGHIGKYHDQAFVFSTTPTIYICQQFDK